MILSKLTYVWVVHDESLLLVVCLEELVNALRGAWGDHVVSYRRKKGDEYGLWFLTYSRVGLTFQLFP